MTLPAGYRLGKIVPFDDHEAEHGFGQSIETDVYRYVLDEAGNQTGQVVRSHGRPTRDILRDVWTQLRVEQENGAWPHLEDFGVSVCRYEPDFPAEWPPNVKWIACYPVTGTSEGHYIHLDLLMRAGDALVRRMIGLGKTFGGRREAYDVCYRIASMLGA